MPLLETEGSLTVYGAKSFSCRLWLRLCSTVVFILTSRRKTGKKFVLAFVSQSINFTKDCLWKYFLFFSFYAHVYFTYISSGGGGVFSFSVLVSLKGFYCRLLISCSAAVDSCLLVCEMLIKFVMRINRMSC